MLVCAPQVARVLLDSAVARSKGSRSAIKFGLASLAIACLIGLGLYAPTELREGSKVFLSEMSRRPDYTGLTSYIEKLRQIREDHKSVDAVVYIPREELFWDKLSCRSAGFFISAISERPALYAWPKDDCYDFLCGPRFHSNGLCAKSQGHFSDEELIGEAKRMGYAQVEVLTSGRIRVLK